MAPTALSQSRAMQAQRLPSMGCRPLHVARPTSSMRVAASSSERKTSSRSVQTAATATLQAPSATASMPKLDLYPIKEMADWTLPTVHEVTPETFDEFIESAGPSYVVVDFYTDWCGPCKLMAPALLDMAKDIQQVRFGKVNCGKCKASFPQSKGIKALPTFHLYQNGQKVDQFVGGKADKLRKWLATYL